LRRLCPQEQNTHDDLPILWIPVSPRDQVLRGVRRPRAARQEVLRDVWHPPDRDRAASEIRHPKL